MPIDDLIDLYNWDYHFGLFGDVIFGEGEMEVGLTEVGDEVTFQHEKETLVGRKSFLWLFLDEAVVDRIAAVQLVCVQEVHLSGVVSS